MVGYVEREGELEREWDRQGQRVVGEIERERERGERGRIRKRVAGQKGRESVVEEIKRNGERERKRE